MWLAHWEGQMAMLRWEVCVFYVFYAFASGSPRGMQIEQRGRTDAVSAPRYKLIRAVILTVFTYRRWLAYSAHPRGAEH